MKNTKEFDAISIEATRRCNLNCRFCDVAEEDEQSFREKLRKELKTSEIKDILAQTRDLQVHGICWTGGEFLLREDAFELLATATNLGLVSQIVTNATLLTRNVIQKIKKITNNKVFFAFSINSLNHNENVWSRDDSPTTAFQAMRMCDAFDIGYSILLTIGKFNLNSLKETITYFQDRKTLVVRSPLTARGKGKHYFKEFAISKEEMKDIVHPILRENPVTYLSFTPTFVSPEFVNKEKPALGMLHPGCYIGKGLAISPEGDVGLCPSITDDVKVGNIREKTLFEIVNSEDFLSLTNMDNLKGKCGRCRYKYTCGGCRAMAYYHAGDYFAEDPLCFFEPQDEKSESEFEELCTQKYDEFLNLSSNMHVFFASLLLDKLLRSVPNLIRRRIINILTNLIGIKQLRRIAKLRPIMVEKLLSDL